MTGFLLDTNVISEYTRTKPPDERVRKWVDSQVEDSLHLSVLTLGEIRKGAILLPPGSKRSQLEQWLEIDLPARFKKRLLPITEPRTIPPDEMEPPDTNSWRCARATCGGTGSAPA